MTTQLSPLPVFRAWDNLGLPLFGGKLFTYVAGTTTKQATFTDSTGGTPNTNPVILNFRGEANVWLDPTKVYKLVLAPANDTDPPTNPFWTVDQISGGSLSPTGSIIPTVDNLFTLGSTSFSWANVYVGPNHAPVLDTTSGNIGYYARTQAEITAAVMPTNFSYPPGNVLRYGADSTGAVDSSAAFLQARQVATQGGIELAIPGGTYKISSTLQWGFASLRVKAYGKVTLSFPALVGQCVAVDGGAGGGGVNDVSITGEIRVVGNAATTDAWFVRACHRSWFELIAADSGCGVRINWCVSTAFTITCSINENGGTFPFQVPQAGIILDQRSVGETVANCLFLLPRIEGITAGNGIGIDLEHTLACTFVGGTSEANKVGVRQLTQTPQDNFSNTITGMDFESNTQNDIVVTGGGSLTLIGCNAQSSGAANPNIDLFGDNCTISGGYARTVKVESASTGTVLIGVQLSDALGITGAGIFKAIGCQLSNGSRTVTAQVPDQIGNTVSTFVPTIVGGTTPGTQTYAANGQKCSYTQIGTTGNGFVDFTMWINLATNTGGTGAATVALPIASRAGTNFLQTVVIGDYTGVTLGAAGRTLCIRINPGTSVAQLLESDTGSVNNFIAIGSVSGTAAIVVSGRYLI